MHQKNLMVELSRSVWEISQGMVPNVTNEQQTMLPILSAFWLQWRWSYGVRGVSWP